MIKLVSGVLPLVSAGIALVATIMVFRGWLRKPTPQMFFWSIGLSFYTVGGLMEAWFGFLGWAEWVFRTWYIFGAILVAAWLGQGTVYLLIRRRWIAHLLMALLAAGSLFAVTRVLGAELDGSQLVDELSGTAIPKSEGVRNLTPFFNIYGVIWLVFGAIWSAFILWRRQVFRNRTIGNILIASGAIAAGIGGALSRGDVMPFGLYLGEFVGIILILWGFVRASTPDAAQAERIAAAV